MKETDPTSVAARQTLHQAVRKDAQQYTSSYIKPLYKEPSVLVEGKGTITADAEGRSYLDFFSGVLSTSVGHCNPEVVQRVKEKVGPNSSADAGHLGESWGGTESTRPRLPKSICST